MDAQRKKAYRRLLYHATLDIRPLGWISFSRFRPFNPFAWRTTLRQIRRAGILADWLHNLALFSSLDFERFNETWFWRDFDTLIARYPDLHLARYKEVFGRELASSDATGG